MYWKTLVHNGVLFPPPYQPLPPDVKALYENKPLQLTEEQEEALCLYAKVAHTLDSTSKKNFFKDWKRLLGKNTHIKDLERLDFSDVLSYLSSVPRIPMATTEELEKYRTAMVDGEPQTVANFIVEPPGLFKGRGDHPLRGRLKTRIFPRDVTLNMSKGVPPPTPNVPGRWKKVIHDKEAMWIASWRQNVTEKVHYVYLGQDSRVRMEKDKAKFEIARKLSHKIDKIRQTIEKCIRSSDPIRRQLCVAIWLIDHLAIRVGNEKSDDEAQTVGVTNLLVKNVTVTNDNRLQLDFLGKDSVRYTKVVDIPDFVFQCVTECLKNKKEGDQVFDKVDAKMVNDYLSELMPGLTAKVFRTMNSSRLFQDILTEKAKDGKKIQVVYQDYVMANIAVAELCNHQKMVMTKQTKTDLTKINARIKKATGEAKRVLQNQKRLTVAKKNLNLSTSRQNYIDPRITVAFAKKVGVPIEKFFSKRLMQKFKWALDTPADFIF